MTTGMILIETTSMVIINLGDFTKARYLNLYSELSDLHDVLSHKVIPHSFEAPGCEEVNKVLLLIERIVNTLPKTP